VPDDAPRDFEIGHIPRYWLSSRRPHPMRIFMRDWVIIVAPLALLMYFLLIPSHFTALLAWLIR
jgi:hypothetical protein